MSARILSRAEIERHRRVGGPANPHSWTGSLEVTVLAAFDEITRLAALVGIQCSLAERARADLVALLEGMEQVGLVDDRGWLPVTIDDGPVYRLSPSAASLHAGLTGAVTGPSAPAAPILRCGECGTTCELPLINGGLDLFSTDAARGWECTTEYGWRCPQHPTPAVGESTDG